MDAKNFPKKGFYYHFKHDPKDVFNNYAYEVLGICRHTENDGLMVAYRPLYDETYMGDAEYLVRPLEMFTENVKVGDREVPRFSRITDPVVVAKLETSRQNSHKRNHRA